ncbi:MAG: cobalt-precorrin-5B (C(1))-methyltransferase CbiD [Cellulosilyticaceae bacterium]
MEQYIYKNNKRLKYGYTTGSCAAAAAKAAAWMILTQEKVEQVELMTPKGFGLRLKVEDICQEKEFVSCSIVKDGGDDPDATHGMKIYARVSQIEEPIITVDGGIGIGRVTKAGLKCAIGCAAINPVPLQMIRNEVENVSKELGYKLGLRVVIYAPEGEARAEKTFNGRLGIVGGISILGTSGIVEPMSEQAIVDTIKIELDMLKANGHEIIAIAPGNYGMGFMKDSLDLEGVPLVKYSNFLGETLDYITHLAFERVLLVGHVGKMVKVAAGVMNTHSKYADARLEVLGVHTAMQGYGGEIIKEIMASTTTDEAIRIIKALEESEYILGSIMDKIKFHIDYRTKQKVAIAIVMFSEVHGLLSTTKNVKAYMNELKGVR